MDRSEACRELAVGIVKHIINHYSLFNEDMISYLMPVLVQRLGGDVVCHGNNKSVDPVMGPLGERMFDQVPGVRQAITRVVAAWLMKLPDRYSYFHRLLPLILTSLCDEMPDLASEAWELWQNIGEQYLLENEKDLKDTMDFLTQPPSHYPPEVRRPNLGCRTLVQRNAGKIIPALANELGDWQVDVRLKASQLLCQLVLNAETHLTHHLEKLLAAMYRAVQDDDARVVENVEKAAKYLAHFVPPSVTLSLVLPAMEDGVTHGHLKVLAGILWGSEKSALFEELEGVTNFLQRHDVCWQQSDLFQRYLQNCMLAILSVCEESVQPVSQQFFNVTFPGAALGDTAVRNTAEELLMRLGQTEGLEPPHLVYSRHAGSLFQDLQLSLDTWIFNSPQRSIFQTLVEKLVSYETAGPYLGIISSLMVYLTTTDKDPRVKLSVYTSLALLLDTKNSPLGSSDELDTFRVTVVQDVILPGLVWQAGRTAETVRTSAVACLWAALQDPVPPSMVRVTDMCLPLVLGLVEDSARKTRLLACRVLRALVQLTRSSGRLNADLIHQVFPAAVKTVVTLYTPLPPDYDVQCSSALVDALYTTMLVHLDDPDPIFQGIMLDALKDVSHIHPRLLWEKLNNSLGNFRNTKDCLIFSLAQYLMADTAAQGVEHLHIEDEVDTKYKPPPEKTIDEILEADKEDESLRKYKEKLLGEAKTGNIIVEPDDPRKVIVKKLALCVPGRPDVELDLTGDISQLKKQVFAIKEGVSYRIRIDFIVQREIVHGLKYIQKTYRMGVPVDKMTHMVGSYPPKTEIQSYTTPLEDAPTGMMARGSYTVHSLFTDDDKHEHLKWEWSFDIKKDWKD
uniref:Rho GDP-dissociation inhibitor 3 n=3 Tax=Timema TaxID=61471 RepID=A0A7R9JRU9_TIMGE|nr:unnamed protein product [Timema genevievae]